MICRAALTETPGRAQGNRNYQQRIEFTTAVRWWFGDRAYVAAQVLFNASLLLANIANIVVCAQVRARVTLGRRCLTLAPRQTIDNILIFCAGGSGALQLFPTVEVVTALETGARCRRPISCPLPTCPRSLPLPPQAPTRSAGDRPYFSASATA